MLWLDFSPVQVPELPEGLRYVQVAAGFGFSILIRPGPNLAAT